MSYKGQMPYPEKAVLTVLSDEWQLVSEIQKQILFCGTTDEIRAVLAKLCDNGVAERHKFRTVGERYEYRLTAEASE